MNQSDLVQRMSLGQPHAIDSLPDQQPNARGMTARDRSLTLAALTNLYLNSGRITAADGSLAIAALTNFYLHTRSLTATAESSLSSDAPIQSLHDQPDEDLEIDAVFVARYPHLVQSGAKAENLERPHPDRDLPKTAGPPVTTAGPSVTPPKSGLTRFDRLMIFTGYAAVVPALAVWGGSQGWFTSRVSNLNSDAGLAITQSDVQFAEYMLRTLDGIDRATAANSKVVTDRSKEVLANLVTRTELNGALTGLVTRAELNQFMKQFLAVLGQRSVITAGQVPAPENLAVAPENSRVAAVRSVPASSASNSDASNNVSQRRLSGVVDWGDKSVVMIEYHGQTQRTYLGQDVGSTGWTLVSVNADQATFHKQGKYQTVADGEFLFDADR